MTEAEQILTQLAALSRRIEEFEAELWRLRVEQQMLRQQLGGSGWIPPAPQAPEP